MHDHVLSPCLKNLCLWSKGPGHSLLSEQTTIAGAPTYTPCWTYVGVLLASTVLLHMCAPPTILQKPVGWIALSVLLHQSLSHVAIDGVHTNLDNCIARKLHFFYCFLHLSQSSFAEKRGIDAQLATIWDMIILCLQRDHKLHFYRLNRIYT